MPNHLARPLPPPWQAMAARRTLILLDGLDEGGRAREEIQRHVAEVLAPQGHVMLVTSRPAVRAPAPPPPHLARHLPPCSGVVLLGGGGLG
jgi:hypothetical protein